MAPVIGAALTSAQWLLGKNWKIASSEENYLPKFWKSDFIGKMFLSGAAQPFKMQRNTEREYNC